MFNFEYALALGSNLGDRLRHLQQALVALEGLGVLLKTSNVYETCPMYVTDQPEFLNAAVTLRCEHPPIKLLSALKKIEQEIGRKDGLRHGPRIVDIDIILCGELQVNEPQLIIPHVSFRERDFVLRPLCEVAADWKDPVSKKTVQELASAVYSHTVNLSAESFKVSSDV